MTQNTDKHIWSFGNFFLLLSTLLILYYILALSILQWSC